MRAAEWYGEDTAPARGAWAYRDRLSRRDLAWLETILGPRYPAPSSMGDYIKAAERFAQLAPDSPDAWYRLGDYLCHNGALVGLTDTWRRASAAFNRSLSLDSTYSPAIQHLSEIAAGLDDSAGARRGLALLTRFDSLSPIAQARRWNVAAILSDTAEMRKTLASDSILDPGPWYVTFCSLDLPLNLAGTDAIYPRALAHSASADDRARIEQTWSRYELMRGHPGHEPPLADQPGAGPPDLRRARRPVRRRRFGSWAGCGGRARASARPAAPRGRPGPGGRAVRRRPVCGGHPTCRSRAPGDRRSPGGSGRFRQPLAVGPASRLCAAARGAGGRRLTAAPMRRNACASSTRRLQIRSGCLGRRMATSSRPGCTRSAGEIPAALAAVRRRAVGMAGFPHYVKYLREEGRLAALTGDREGAIRAYRHYLALRGDAEPGLQPEVRRVREELEAVERESPTAERRSVGIA